MCVHAVFVCLYVCVCVYMCRVRVCVCPCVCVCVCMRANAGTFTQRQLVDSEIKQRHKDKVCYRLHPIVDCSTMWVGVLC